MRKRWITLIAAAIIVASVSASLVVYSNEPELRCCEGQYTIYFGPVYLFSKNNTFVFSVYNPGGATTGEVSSVTLNDTICSNQSWKPIFGDGNLTPEFCTLSTQVASGKNYDYQLVISFSAGMRTEGVTTSGQVSADNPSGS